MRDFFYIHPAKKRPCESILFDNFLYYLKNYLDKKHLLSYNR